MNKYILWITVLGSIFTGTTITRGQILTNTTMEPTASAPKLRIVFEGVFTKSRSTNSNPYYFGSDNFGNYQNISPYSSTIMQTTGFGDFGYNNFPGSRISFGFDTNFQNRSGRKFVISTRTSFMTSKEVNYKSKESWLTLHSEGYKPSSVVFDVSIKVNY